MNRTVIGNKAVGIAARICEALDEYSTGDYSTDDIVKLYDTLNDIEALLNKLVVVNRNRTISNDFCMKPTATPTIIKGERERLPSPGRSPLDLPHDTDRLRKFK